MSRSLCGLSKKDIKKDFAGISKLVDRPKFMCKNCARAANSKKDLCNPVSLKGKAEGKNKGS